jgi:thioredoxin-dependent peroxiredoxin
MDSQVLAISTDFVATLSHWSKELNAEFPMLSDHDRKVSELYGVLNAQVGIANRTTFIIDTDGKIVQIDENRDAIDATKAETACSRLAHKKQ